MCGCSGGFSGSNCESECILWGICRVCTATISVVPAMSSGYNPLPRAAGKIQYEAETKPRSSNCILPEALRSGLELLLV